MSDNTNDFVEMLAVAYQKVACFPEEDPSGLLNLLALRNLVPEAIEEISRLKAEIADLRRSRNALRDAGGGE